MKNALEEPIDNPKQQPEVCQDPKRGELFFHLLFLLNTVWENSIWHPPVFVGFLTYKEMSGL